MPESRASRTLAAWCAANTQMALVLRIEALTGRRIRQSTVSRWITGDRLPMPRFVALLADELGIPPQHWYLAP